MHDWPEHVTAWNRKGLNWREWTTPELLLIVHQENIESIYKNKPMRLRRYLIDMQDDAMLIQLDRANMGSGSAK